VVKIPRGNFSQLADFELNLEGQREYFKQSIFLPALTDAPTDFTLFSTSATHHTVDGSCCVSSASFRTGKHRSSLTSN